MRLIDTVAVIGCLNPNDRVHKASLHHLALLSSDTRVFIPAVTLVEADLVMKARGYNDSERESAWRAFEGIIPKEKILPNSASSIQRAVALQRQGLDYFDSLVAALAAESGSTVVTTDNKIGETVGIEW